MITMQLAYDALAEHVVSAKLAEGTNWLSGVRLGEPRDDGCVHVHRSGDSVLCSHGDDVIVTQGIGEGDALNRLLSFSDDLMDLERKLSAFLLDNNLQRVTDEISSTMRNPVMIVDAQNMMCTMSGEGLKDILPQWEYVKRSGRLPWDALEFMDRDMVFASKMLSAGDRPFVAETYVKGLQSVVCRIRDVAGEFTAFIFIFCSQTALGVGTLQLAELAIGYIRSWIETHQGEQRMFSRADFLTRIAEGAQPTSDEIVEQSRLMGIVGHDYVLVRMLPPRNRSQAWTASVFQDVIHGCHCFEVRDNLYALCVGTSDLIDRLKGLAAQYSIRFGLSWRFSDWLVIPDAVNQTEVALAYTADSVSVLDSHCVLFYVFSILMSSTKNIEIIHPAIEMLAEYDEAHGSEYLRTLWLYLRHERNLVKTAEDLNIHRNSLVYRVKRISELIADVDLDDPETREHLMMSFRIQGLRDRA